MLAVFVLQLQSSVFVTGNAWLVKPEIFNIRFFTEKCLPTPDLSHYHTIEALSFFMHTCIHPSVHLSIHPNIT
jgi:hypothetical protein